MARRKFEDDFPDQGQVAERWRAFCQRMDQLERNMAELAELGQTLVVALNEAAAQTGSPLLGLLQRVMQGFRETQDFYKQQRGE